MHALDIAAAHLVPIIAGEFELGGGRQLHLRVGDQIVEPGLAGGLLAQEPAHVVEPGLLGQPGEERIALSRAGLLQGFEPGDEAVGIIGHPRRLVGDLRRAMPP